ncbi:hypothetical protein PCE1_002526 [Barthelona sp. PCE]
MPSFTECKADRRVLICDQDEAYVFSPDFNLMKAYIGAEDFIIIDFGEKESYIEAGQWEYVPVYCSSMLAFYSQLVYEDNKFTLLLLSVEKNGTYKTIFRDVIPEIVFSDICCMAMLDANNIIYQTKDKEITLFNIYTSQKRILTTDMCLVNQLCVCGRRPVIFEVETEDYTSLHYRYDFKPSDICDGNDISIKQCVHQGDSYVSAIGVSNADCIRFFSDNNEKKMFSLYTFMGEVIDLIERFPSLASTRNYLAGSMILHYLSDVLCVFTLDTGCVFETYRVTADKCAVVASGTSISQCIFPASFEIFSNQIFDHPCISAVLCSHDRITTAPIIMKEGLLFNTYELDVPIWHKELLKFNVEEGHVVIDMRMKTLRILKGRVPDFVPPSVQFESAILKIGEDVSLHGVRDFKYRDSNMAVILDVGEQFFKIEADRIRTLNTNVNMRYVYIAPDNIEGTFGFCRDTLGMYHIFLINWEALSFHKSDASAFNVQWENFSFWVSNTMFVVGSSLYRVYFDGLFVVEHVEDNDLYAEMRLDPFSEIFVHNQHSADGHLLISMFYDFRKPHDVESGTNVVRTEIVDIGEAFASFSLIE